MAAPPRYSDSRRGRTERKNRSLRSHVTRFAEDVAIRDDVADNRDILSGKFVAQHAIEEILAELPTSATCRQSSGRCRADAVRFQGRTQIIEDRAGRNHDIARRKHDPPPERLDERFFSQKARVRRPFVVLALDVNVRPKSTNNRLGSGSFGNHDVIDKLQSRETLGTKLLRHIRRLAVGLFDGVVAAQRNNQHFTLLVRELEILEVTGMDNIEAAVAMNHGASLSAVRRSEWLKLLDRAELAQNAA